MVLNSGERADCITNFYSVEFDFAKKYYEAIGQSLLCFIDSNKLPAIVLILENKKYRQYLYRLMVVASKYNIKA